ncbi:FAD-dependent oxidoreductase [Desulfolutivibrio sulfoxidireducens]|uniref:FAD-dependent oxidoreductase n=1 Tax=Desulfolutivibrio sulfoxidireducens TaxID=2773299 RepID=UPI00159E1F10|nr:FAD-dependent oxidoreductase [Desulfolutivibrio sulfoxidireducens]QLA20457.1 4Fe-4S dicluster domain-containing protein [Desulfolutivibrio sulfoxidireducens]
MKTTYDALVVGAGIGGIRSALDLAEAGHKVALIDKRPNIGGLLTKLDHQFPSDHCGMCKMLPLTERESSSQFCLRKGLFHKNIEIMLSSELISLEGEPGKFQAVVNRKASFVDPTKCIGCGLCAEVCPVKVKSEFNAGLSERGAIHLPVPHGIPNTYAVDLESCMRCWKCFETCPTGAIDFKLAEREEFKILVADPDEGAIKQYSKWFEDLKFPFLQATTGERAIELISADESIRMLLLDMSIKDMEPQRVLTRALEICPELAVIILAGPTRGDQAQKLVGLGARDSRLHPLRRSTFVPWLDKHYMRIMADERVKMDVAAVILAVGFECYDPSELSGILGYGVLPGVVTSLEFERLLSGTGPTAGSLRRPADGGAVRKIAWLQCVGSRDIQKNADFCSSFCCMASIKEALLAKRTLGQEVETTIFYMDMRTFGRDFDRYRREAKDIHGVRFIRSRPHSVMPGDPEAGGLRLQYIDDQGSQREEFFDMVVLGVGARPPAGMTSLARAADIETNAFGFCKSQDLNPGRTTRLGVFAAGSANGPKDIAESVLQSGAAALGASRLINLFAPIRGRVQEPRPAYRNVARQAPAILAVVCRSCPVMRESLDMERIGERLGSLPSVRRVETVDRACTTEGWNRIKELAEKEQPNRILIGACMPYAYVPRLRELGGTLGLNPALMDVVDIHTPMFSGPQAEGPECLERTERDILAALRMSAAKLLGADPAPLRTRDPVVPAALVVGGGLAGMTAAVGIADHDYKVTLVESGEKLGGLAMNVHWTLQGGDPPKLMEELIDQVGKHPNIRVLTNARVSLSTGAAGRFMSIVSTDKGGIPVEHGVTILATGGRRAKVYDFGFLDRKTVLTHQDFETRLATGVLDTTALSSVALIQCWRFRDAPRGYCSRVCCAEALKIVLFLKKKHPDLPVYVLYRDIMSYGFSEEYYTKARKAGAIFIRYDPERKPLVRIDDATRPIVTVYDQILGRELELHVDLLSLSDGIEPNDVEEVSEVFGVPTGPDGFFQEAESKWRPVDFLKQGVFVCGVARGPATMAETIVSAKAAAQRSLRVLCDKSMAKAHVVAEVRPSLCSLCGRCLAVCPYGARTLDMEEGRIVVDDLLCQGCGSCAAVCPNSASFLRGFSDHQVMSVIDASLADMVRTEQVE